MAGEQDLVRAEAQRDAEVVNGVQGERGVSPAPLFVILNLFQDNRVALLVG
jgi:hypothetical protein